MDIMTFFQFFPLVASLFLLLLSPDHDTANS